LILPECSSAKVIEYSYYLCGLRAVIIIERMRRWLEMKDDLGRIDVQEIGGYTSSYPV